MNREMEVAVQQGQFLEHAEVHGNLYGTAKSSLQSVQDRGCMCMIDVDVQVRLVRPCVLQLIYLVCFTAVGFDCRN
jgi:guanylate kinase